MTYLGIRYSGANTVTFSLLGKEPSRKTQGGSMIRKTASVVVSTTVDGSKRRRKATTRSARVEIVSDKVPAIVVEAALRQSDGDIRRIRFVRDSASLGGWSAMVFNTPAQARDWDRQK